MISMTQQMRTASASTASIDPERAWQPYVPSPERPWDLRRAGHLWRRVANGATWSELQNSLKYGPQATVDRLLEPGEDAAEFEQTRNLSIGQIRRSRPIERYQNDRWTGCISVAGPCRSGLEQYRHQQQ